jgi:hypothetical protein
MLKVKKMRGDRCMTKIIVSNYYAISVVLAGSINNAAHNILGTPGTENILPRVKGRNLRAQATSFLSWRNIFNPTHFNYAPDIMIYTILRFVN